MDQLQQPISLEKGWSRMETAIEKLKRILDGKPEQFNSEEYSMNYTTIYNMCTQKPPNVVFMKKWWFCNMWLYVSSRV